MTDTPKLPHELGERKSKVKSNWPRPPPDRARELDAEREAVPGEQKDR